MNPTDQFSFTGTVTASTSLPRELRRNEIDSDLVVVGGGLSGVCCAITAAREGLRVTLAQDRPVLGGNASSEVRLWVLGATSHMGNNNRWAREGGVIDELLVENLWRNPEGNAVLFDSVLLEYVQREHGITLLLNTAVYSVEMNASTIRSVTAFCSQNQMEYHITAPLFCDASGDGILGFLSGASFRIGAEAQSEFGERLAPEQERHELLGHSLYFYSRDTGQPIKYVPTALALKDITEIPRFRELRVTDTGCRLWWLEYGGARDTVYETEEIKWELWRVAYGVWNYIKNSGEFPEAETLTLEWMGMIPGKRESRRFEGDIMLTQQDIVEQRTHPDAVSFGGWAIDLHPSEGVFSSQSGCTQWHSKGVYQIPYRTMYSRDISNLFLAGRLISATHIAFGSTRVMATCAHNAQAVGMAAAIAHRRGLQPRDLIEPKYMHLLQQELLRSGQHIPGVLAKHTEDKALFADVDASSTLRLGTLPANGKYKLLDKQMAMLLPLSAGRVPVFTLTIRSQKNLRLRAQLWGATRRGNTTPDVLLSKCEVDIASGISEAIFQFEIEIDEDAHVFFILNPEEGAEIALNDQQITGVLAVSQKVNHSVAKGVVQLPPEGSGIDTFAFWLPDRRPGAALWSMRIEPALTAFNPANVINGVSRPWAGVNAWLPDKDDTAPWLRLRWTEPQQIRTIQISFDTDFDHPMESVLMGHPERVMPACVTSFEVFSASGHVLAHVAENHQTRWLLTLPTAISTDEIVIMIRSHGPAIPAIFEVRCY
jgi:FAD dependent oxidoreductase